MGGHHTDQIISCDLFDFKGIYDIKESQIKKAKDLGFNTFANIKEVITLKPDIAIIATPNDSHITITKQLMNNKINVICEKPVAMNLEELKEMILCANQNNVKFTVNQNRRFDTDFLTAKRVINDREVGDVFHYESKVMGSRGIPGDWRAKVEHGGGMLLDWGIHLLDQVLLLTDTKIKSIYAEFSNVSNELVDDGFRVHLKYVDGMTGLIEVGTCHFFEIPRWYICGNNGSALMKLWEEKGQKIVVNSWESKDVKPVRAAAGFTKTMAPRIENQDDTSKHHLDFEKANPIDIYKNFEKAIKCNDELIITHDSLLRTFKFIEMVQESVKDNKVIELQIGDL